MLSKDIPSGSDHNKTYLRGQITTRRTFGVRSQQDVPSGSNHNKTYLRGQITTRRTFGVRSQQDVPSGSDHNRSHIGPSWGTSCLRSMARIWSRVWIDGDRPPCTQNIYKKGHILSVHTTTSIQNLPADLHVRQIRVCVVRGHSSIFFWKFNTHPLRRNAGHHVWKSQAGDKSLAKNDDLLPRELFVYEEKISARGHHYNTICQGAPVYHYLQGDAILPLSARGAPFYHYLPEGCHFTTICQGVPFYHYLPGGAILPLSARGVPCYHYLPGGAILPLSARGAPWPMLPLSSRGRHFTTICQRGAMLPLSARGRQFNTTTRLMLLILFISTEHN